MSLTGLIDISPGVLTSTQQVARIKDTVFKLLLRFERTETPTSFHFLFFDSSLSADEESKRIRAVQDQLSWCTSSHERNSERSHLRQESGGSCDCDHNNLRVESMKGQSCAPSQTFDDFCRQLDAFFGDKHKSASCRPHFTPSSLWRTMNRFKVTGSQCKNLRLGKGLTNLVIIFSSVPRTDDETSEFFHLSDLPAEALDIAESAKSTNTDCSRLDSFVLHLKHHSERLRTDGFEVQWADMRLEDPSHTRISARANLSVLDAIRQEWSLAWEIFEFQGRGLLVPYIEVPYIEAWQALKKVSQDACRGHLEWGKYKFGTVSLVQIQR